MMIEVDRMIREVRIIMSSFEKIIVSENWSDCINSRKSQWSQVLFELRYEKKKGEEIFQRFDISV